MRTLYRWCGVFVFPGIARTGRQRHEKARFAGRSGLEKWLVRRGKYENPEGTSRSRNVVIEFKDYETALACYNSPEYQRLVKIRKPHAENDLIIIEGYEGAQPAA